MNGVLPHEELVGLVPSAIVGGDAQFIRTASYDMRLGDEYYLHDESSQEGKGIRRRGTGQIVIPPNGLLICTMLESLNLPPDIVGHLSLKVALLMKGIMMASQSQIDAGYEGKIFGMLYNLSHKPVCLRDGELVLRLELVRMEARPRNTYNNTVSKTATLSTYLDAPLFSSLVEIRHDASSALKKVSEVKEKVEEAKDKISSTQLWGALIAAFAALLGVIAQARFAPDSKVDELETKTQALETQWKVLEASSPSKSRLEDLEKENKDLSKRIEELEARISPTSSKKSQSSNGSR